MGKMIPVMGLAVLECRHGSSNCGRAGDVSLRRAEQKRLQHAVGGFGLAVSWFCKNWLIVGLPACHVDERRLE